MEIRIIPGVISLVVGLSGAIIPAGHGDLASARQPPSMATAKLYVADTQGEDLAIIDAANMKLLRHAEVGLNPHGAVASPDGRTLYVTVEGTNELVALDTSTD